MLLKLLINTIAVFLIAHILPQVHVDSLLTAIIVAILLGIVNIVIRPIIVILTLPATIITFGLFTFIINAFMVVLVDTLVQGFHIDNFIWTLVFSLALSVTTSLLKSLQS
jgi:putative membrane protein